jgi:hypothetical protein
VADVGIVKTAVGATMVEIVWLSRGGSRGVEHHGCAQDGAGVGVLKAAVRSGGRPIRLCLLADDGGHIPARIGAAATCRTRLR